MFATRLTRLTRALRAREPDARARARGRRGARTGPAAPGSARRCSAFNDRHGRRGMARGAVVVIVSDGWERGDPELRRRARWSACAGWRTASSGSTRARRRRGFAPLVGGMAAALPYCDAFVSGHSLAALEAVADAIAGTDRRSP